MASYARAPEDDHDDGDYAPHSPYPQYDYPASSAGGGGGMRDEAPQQRGHAPELSMSFYNEAAAALSGPASVHAPSVRGGGAAEPLQASLPALLSSPYGAQHAAQTSTPNPFAGGPVEDAYAAPPQQYAAPYGQEAYDYGTGFDDAGYGGNYANPNADMERDAGSPRSSYDDKTEVSHTPMPLGYGAGAAPTPSSYLRDDGQGFSRGGGGDEDEDDDDDNGQRYPGYAGYAKEYSNPPEQWGDEDGEREHDMNAAETMHFGPAPPRGAQLRRHKTRKNVKLTHGNLVLDCPVPTKLQGFLSRRGDEEFTSMRYTAVTSNPDDFFASHFNLRPAILNRHTEIHIAITLYNEDEILFTRTLHGVMKNIAHLCSRHKSRTWGPDGWKKVVVSIIADGRKKIHPRVLDCLAALGVYQEGVAKNSVNGKQVQAHVYEYTTQLSIDSNLQFKGAERGLVPMQIIFCMKEKNAKKINSHRWFFNAFGPVLQPNVCILIDAGTRPEAKSIYRLWKAFDLNSNVGGACGEIEVDNGGKWGVGPLLINPFVSAQNYEYKVSNQLEKTTESLLGNISVLPGAFSAYRYIALQNNESGLGPLASYFKGETIAGDAQTFSHANMYLAEDRILCFELAAKRGESWVLRYVPNARGVTDVPDTLHELISQRRRWLNGSFFAALYSLTHTGQYLSSGHGFWRRSALLFGSVYSLVNLSFAWFSLGNFYIFFRLLTSSLEAKEFKLKGIKYVNTGAQYLYLGTTIACFILALGNRPAGSKHKFLAAAGIYAVLTAYMMVAAVLCLVKVVKAPERDAIYSQMIFSVLATYGVYFMSALIALDPMHLLTSFAQYMLIAPSYINILNAYAFANLHDFSWGTKGITKDETDLGTVVSSGKGTVEVVLPTAQADIDLEYDQSLNNLRTRPMIIRGEASREEKEEIRNDWFRDIRTNVLLLWTLSNGILAALILGGDNAGTFDPGSGTTRSKIYMLIILIFLGAMAIIRFTLSSVFQIHRLLVG